MTPSATPADPGSAERSKRHAAALSIVVNVGLLALKVVVGVVTGSVALWASAADSLLDLTASGFAYLGVRMGSKPPDDSHPYGHEKLESLSSLVQLSLLFVTVGIIVVEAGQRLAEGAAVSTPLAGVAVIAVSMVVDLWISRRLRRVAAATGGSQALEADALHFATDVWSNVAVIVGLLATRAGFPVGDPIAAFVVAVLVASTAIGLLRDVTRSLTDRAPDARVVERLTTTLGGFEEVRGFHTLRARMVASRIHLDVCVELDPDLTFRRSHDLSHELAAALHDAVPALADVMIHTEPADHPVHQDRDHHARGYDALQARAPRGTE